MTPLRTRSFLSLMVHLKEFGPLMQGTMELENVRTYHNLQGDLIEHL
jgi:hypothetical protein